MKHPREVFADDKRPIWTLRNWSGWGEVAESQRTPTRSWFRASVDLPEEVWNLIDAEGFEAWGVLERIGAYTARYAQTSGRAIGPDGTPHGVPLISRRSGVNNTELVKRVMEAAVTHGVAEWSMGNLDAATVAGWDLDDIRIMPTEDGSIRKSHRAKGKQADQPSREAPGNPPGTSHDSPNLKDSTSHQTKPHHTSKHEIDAGAREVVDSIRTEYPKPNGPDRPDLADKYIIKHGQETARHLGTTLEHALGWILGRVHDYADSPEVVDLLYEEDGRFIPNLITWLEDGCYEPEAGWPA